jgi:hypothetical protein
MVIHDDWMIWGWGPHDLGNFTKLHHISPSGTGKLVQKKQAVL